MTMKISIQSLHCPKCKTDEGLQNVTCTGTAPGVGVFICDKCDTSFYCAEDLIY